jgi:hypothetical protein
MVPQGSRTNRVQRKDWDGDRAAIKQADRLRKALNWVIDEKMFAKLARHGNTSWTASQLLFLTVLWVWSDKSTLTGAFEEAMHLSRTMLGQVALTTYQGLSGALISWSDRLLPCLIRHLHSLMEKAGGSYWRIGQWLPLAVDGSRVNTSRTKSNERAFSAKHFGRGHTARSRQKWRNKKRRTKRLSERVKPQIWLTLLWHMGLKMPWSWKTGPSTASERGHLLELVQTEEYPKDTLFCGDAGFVGYELWKAVLDAGHSFLIRVGGNVKLLRELGHARHRRDLVYLWPDSAARKKQPPLTLRLLEFQGPRGAIYLATNVLSNTQLTVRQAGELYQLRWGVELQFRSFKQTFGRSKLRSRTASRALTELDWSLIGLWIIQLFAVKEQIPVESPPERSSVALALSAIHDAIQMRSESLRPADSQLSRRLRDAVKDEYQRHGSKQARYRQHYKDQPSATKPKIVRATNQQIETYQALTLAA